MLDRPDLLVLEPLVRQRVSIRVRASRAIDGEGGACDRGDSDGLPGVVAVDDHVRRVVGLFILIAQSPPGPNKTPRQQLIRFFARKRATNSSTVLEIKSRRDDSLYPRPEVGLVLCPPPPDTCLARHLDLLIDGTDDAIDGVGVVVAARTVERAGVPAAPAAVGWVERVVEPVLRWENKGVGSGGGILVTEEVGAWRGASGLGESGGGGANRDGS